MNHNCCCKATLKLNTEPLRPIYLNPKDTGPMGPQGNGIDRIEKTATVGLVDTYTIYYTDGTETTFDVTNGRSSEIIVRRL